MKDRVRIFQDHQEFIIDDGQKIRFVFGDSAQGTYLMLTPKRLHEILMKELERKNDDLIK